MATWQHLRSSTANKRPTTSLADGRIAINTNTASPGLFFKDSAGTGIVKVGPVHVGTTAPNSVPAAGGSSGNYTGEQWLDTSVSPAQMKVWNGSTWVGIVADELPVSKLQDGAARQLIQTDAAGTGVEWTSDVDVPGTLDVTSTATFDSIAQHPLGTAGAPTITFTGDNNTGIYSPGADQVAISTGGSGKLFVDASGNVTVDYSSASVQSNFRVKTNSAGAVANAYFGIDATDYFRIYVTNGETWLRNPQNTPMAFHTNNTERLRITSAGLVGVGTSSPGYKLDVNGEVAFSPNTAGKNTFYFTTNASNDASLFLKSDTTNKVNIQANGPSYFNGGSVGIGTTGPIGIFSARAVTNGNLHIRDINTIVSGTGVALDVLNDASTTVQDLALRGATTSFHRAGSESARIDSSGRLLVGTSSAFDTANVGTSYQLGIERGGSEYGALSLKTNSQNANGAYINLGKARGTGANSKTLVADNDELGGIYFEGADGASMRIGARVAAFVDGTPSASDLPTRLVFSTTPDSGSSPQERMRITNSGTVAIGDTSGATRLVVKGEETLSLFTNTTATTATFRTTMSLADGFGTERGSIKVSTTGTQFNTSSDYRLKENVVPVSDGIARLQRLKPSRFNFIGSGDTVVDGFIAHEVQTVVPEAVAGAKDEVDAEGNPKYQGIDQSKLVPLLTAALQEAVAKIESLEARLTAAGI